jgi:hypothetical protein
VTYDTWKLQDPESAGFYRFDEKDEEDDMERSQQCAVEGRAYLVVARQACSEAVRCLPSYGGPKAALDEIQRARDALTEAALRISEYLKLREAADRDEMPF